MKNNGSGDFTVGPPVPVGLAPRFGTVIDIDSDGDLDIAVANLDSGNVSILKNDGFGNFSGTSVPIILSGPLSVTAGDFDRDGDLDLAVAANGAGNGVNSGIAILTNGGAGTFSQTSVIDVPGCEFPLASGDLDGDNDVDLAVPTHCSFSVWVLKNDGNGGFAVSSSVEAGNYPSFVAVADLNSDGDLDLAVPNRNDASSLNSTVTILSNSGTASFSKTNTPTVGGDHPVVVAVGDFDGDGDSDLAASTSNQEGGGTVSLLTNDGTGVFAEVLTVGSAPSSAVVFGDFDTDGDMDVAATQAPTGIHIWKNEIAPPCRTVLPFGWPTASGASQVSQDYAEFDSQGTGRPNHYHTGIDLASPSWGLPQQVLAAATGEVVAICPNGVAGGCVFGGVEFSRDHENHGLQGVVILKHRTSSSILYSLYGHLGTVENFEPGACIEKGTVIGETGGRPDAHLHFEVKSEPVLHNPLVVPGTCIDRSGTPSDVCFGYTLVDPSTRGYHDPIRFFHLLEDSGFPKAVTLSDEKDKKKERKINVRVGPGTFTSAYPVIGKAEEGSYTALSRVVGATADPNCLNGWYQIRRSSNNDCSVIGNCFVVNDKTTRGGVAEGWVCGDFVKHYSFSPSTQPKNARRRDTGRTGLSKEIKGELTVGPDPRS